VRGASIGAGSHGIVSLAMNGYNGQLFAVKSATGYSCVLDNEYRILHCMDSPYIVRCLGRNYSVENGVGTHNLFMEYMPGGSLGDLLIKFGGRLNDSVIRAYTHGILRGIHYLHRQGIVHCDIKGKNVLVGANGVKLADFGFAKRSGDEKEGQETLQLRGTPLWMAPEVVNQVEQGPASDIWSLGCTVLEMATGRPPWRQVSNPLAAMYQIGCTETLPELPASLSAQIQDFLEKCFRRDPKKRWTCAELLNHHFLNEDWSTMKEEAIRGTGSPTSNLDLGNQVWNSCQTTIPSLGIPSPTGESNSEVNMSIDPCQRPSPRERVMALAAGCKSGDIADWPNWSAITHDQRVVVRSSRGNSPTSDKPVSKLDISNGSSIQELPFRKEKCSANLEAASWEELQPRGELDECLDIAVSASQPEHQSSSSTYAETLHHDLFQMAAASI